MADPAVSVSPYWELTFDADGDVDGRERDRLLGIIENQTRLLPAPNTPEPKKTFWQRLFSS